MAPGVLCDPAMAAPRSGSPRAWRATARPGPRRVTAAGTPRRWRRPGRYPAGRFCVPARSRRWRSLGVDHRRELLQALREARAGTGDEVVLDHVHLAVPVSYTHLRAHETGRNLVC